MESALEQKPDHKQAQDYIRRSREQIFLPQIETLLDGYSSALQNGTLPLFYERNCLPESLPRIKTEAELISRAYTGLQCFVSDIQVRLPEESRAEAEFTHIITGKSRASGAKTVLFEGVMSWEFVRRDGAWKIADITSRRSDGKPS
jgi:hypothetical protein